MKNLIDMTEGKLQETLKFAETIKDNSLMDCLKRLEIADENLNTQTTIFNDFAPHSFEFCRKRGETFAGNGGVIFHGRHDNGGDGGAPTFSVCLEPTNGWSIHT